MKKITTVVVLILFSFNINAQRFSEIVMWEVETRSAGLLFGISETKDKADVVMLDFQKRNANTKYDITSQPAKYKFTTVPKKNANDNPVDNFKSQMGGKLYKVFYKEDIKDFEIAKSEGSAALIAYCLDSKKTDTKIASNDNDAVSVSSQSNTSEKNYQKYVLWEVETRIDGLLFGVAMSKDDADAVMLDFQKRNADTKYDISRYPAKYKFSSAPIQNQKENPVTIFKSYTKGRAYKVLSAEDIKGIEIAKSKGFDSGVDYYVGVRGADRDFVVKRLKNLLTNLSKFRIKPSSYLAASSD